jgi:hypothetical protein
VSKLGRCRRWLGWGRDLGVVGGNDQVVGVGGGPWRNRQFCDIRSAVEPIGARCEAQDQGEFESVEVQYRGRKMTSAKSKAGWMVLVALDREEDRVSITVSPWSVGPETRRERCNAFERAGRPPIEGSMVRPSLSGGGILRHRWSVWRLSAFLVHGRTGSSSI